MESIAKWLLFVFVSVLAGFIVFYLVRWLSTAFEVLSDIFVLFRLFTGERTHRSTKRPNRLYVYTCETQYLDEVTINELYNFLVGPVIDTHNSYESKDQTINALHKVILSYTNIMLFRDKIDGSLRGVMMVGFIRTKEYTLLKMGLTFFKNYYKGGPFSYIGMASFALKELILHPFTPLYTVGKAFGYKSYMVATRFKECYPCYNKETPEFFKKILSEYAHSVMLEGDTYDEKTSVLKQERTSLTENLLAVSEQDLQNPQIKFFVETNPGYLKGHCLVTAWRVNWADLGTIIARAFKRAVRGKQHKDGPRRESQNPSLKKKKPKLLKRYTFQECSANAYAVSMYQMDLAGEAVLSPTNNFTFDFSQVDSSGAPDSPNHDWADAIRTP